MGRTTDPKMRLYKLQTGHPAPLTIHHQEWMDPARVEAVERMAHALLADWKTRGEWFAVEPQLAVEAVASAARQSLGAGAKRTAEAKLSEIMRLYDLGDITPAQLKACLVFRRLSDIADGRGVNHASSAADRSKIRRTIKESAGTTAWALFENVVMEGERLNVVADLAGLDPAEGLKELRKAIDVAAPLTATY